MPRSGAGPPTRSAPSARASSSRGGPARGWPTWSSSSSTPPCWSHSDLLLSEALRGDGATLIELDGSRFIDELAPRDVVARAVAAHPDARLDLRPGRPAQVRGAHGPADRGRLPARQQPHPGPAGGPLLRRRHRHGPRRRDERATACTRPGSAPTPGSTAPTGWPRTRSRSASCSVDEPPSRPLAALSRPTPDARAAGAPGSHAAGAPAWTTGRSPRRSARRSGAAPASPGMPQA